MNMRRFALPAAIVLLTCISQLQAQGPYKATWESLDSHKMPEWYKDAKIGLSMHWGVYSVPAWAPRRLDSLYDYHKK